MTAALKKAGGLAGFEKVSKISYVRSFGLFLLMPLLAIGLPAGERSFSAAYGPKNQILLTANFGTIGFYGQPIFALSHREVRRETEYGIRWGALYSYAAFDYRKLECRAQVGAGGHYAQHKVVYRGREAELPEFEASQRGFDIWLQPEFRFYERFALLVEAHVFRYLWEENSQGMKEGNAVFITPDLSLSGIRIGFRYYLHWEKKPPGVAGP